MFIVIPASVLIILLCLSLILLRVNLSGAVAQDIRDPEKLKGTRLERYAAQMGRDSASLSERCGYDVCVVSRDGTKLYGTMYPAEGPDTVLLAHGYRSSGINDFCGIALWYLERGFSVLMIDERAHQRSGGRYITFGIRERYDMLKWIGFLKTKTEERIWLHGVSMGAASLLMALPLCEGIKISGIVADSTFDNVYELLTYQLNRRYHVPVWIGSFLMHAAGYILIGREAAYLYPSECLRESGIRALVIHGDRDATVPPGMHDRFASVPNADARIVPGARHALCWAEDPKGYAEMMDEFIFNPSDPGKDRPVLPGSVCSSEGA